MQSESYRLLGMNSGRVEQADVGVFLVHEHSDLRAPLDNCLSAALDEIVHDLEKRRPGFVPGDAEAEIIVDHAM